MRRLVFFSLLTFVLLVMFVPNSSDPRDYTGDGNPGHRYSSLAGVWQVFQKLIKAPRDALYLLVELTLDLLNRDWQATPSPHKVIMAYCLPGRHSGVRKVAVSWGGRCLVKEVVRLTYDEWESLAWSRPRIESGPEGLFEHLAVSS